MQTHAIVMHETGGPEVLRWQPFELPPPAAFEVRVRPPAVFGQSSGPSAPFDPRLLATYPLRDAERAHRDLEARRTTGSTLQLP